MNTERTQKKRGRPKIDISWPDAAFTVKDVMGSMQNPPSNVLVHLKIKEGIRDGRIRQIGKKAGNTGRPQNIYRRVLQEENASI
jgi:hypothetical protein